MSKPERNHWVLTASIEDLQVVCKYFNYRNVEKRTRSQSVKAILGVRSEGKDVIDTPEKLLPLARVKVVENEERKVNKLGEGKEVSQAGSFRNIDDLFQKLAIPTKTETEASSSSVSEASISSSNEEEDLTNLQLKKVPRIKKAKKMEGSNKKQDLDILARTYTFSDAPHEDINEFLDFYEIEAESFYWDDDTKVNKLNTALKGPAMMTFISADKLRSKKKKRGLRSRKNYAAYTGKMMKKSKKNLT